MKKYACSDGMCGAVDCVTCRGPGAGDPEPQEQVEDYARTERVVTARKARYVGTPGEIRPGDRMRVVSGYGYIVGGPRTGHYRNYYRLERGPAWDADTDTEDPHPLGDGPGPSW